MLSAPSVLVLVSVRARRHARRMGGRMGRRFFERCAGPTNLLHKLGIPTPQQYNSVLRPLGIPTLCSRLFRPHPAPGNPTNLSRTTKIERSSRARSRLRTHTRGFLSRYPFRYTYITYCTGVSLQNLQELCAILDAVVSLNRFCRPQTHHIITRRRPYP